MEEVERGIPAATSLDEIMYIDEPESGAIASEIGADLSGVMRMFRKKVKGTEHETTELQLRRMEAELRKLAEQDPNDQDVRTLLDQTVAALDALRLEAQSSGEGTATEAGSIGE